MTEPFEHADLDALRDFRRPVVEPHQGLRERIEERVWNEILAEESGHRRARAGMRWSLRHIGIAGIAATIAAVFAFSSGTPNQTTPQTQASIDPLDLAARSLGGDNAASSSQFAVGALPETAPLVAGTRAVVFESGEAVPMESIAAGPTEMTPEQLALLPDDEAVLLAILRAVDGRDSSHDADFAPFKLAALYVSDRRVPAATRLAFVKLLRLLDGVSVGGSAFDVFGRPGVLVQRLDTTSLILQQYLLDPRHGQLLEHREHLAASLSYACPAGTVITLEAFDDSGFRVPATSAPHANWPRIVPECDPA